MDKDTSYLRSARCCVTVRVGHAVLVLGLLLTAAMGVTLAQEPSGVVATPSMPNSPQLPAKATTAAAQTDDRYRIGPGDVLDIRVFNRPQLSREAVRVDARGMIRMPLIATEIKAACRTEIELGQEIATRYLKYQRNPQVDVFVKEFQSQPVAVIGAVTQPGRFQLQRQVRLLELLAFAGGPNERAGRNIHVVHAEMPSLCETETSAAAHGQPDELATGFVAYRLNDTLRGTGDANPWVRPGDVITLPEAEQVYVVGNVLRPTAIPMKEPVTVSQAIAMAGGLMPDSKSEKVRIVRQEPGKMSKTELLVDLKAIDKRQAEDIALQPNDIVDVPTSGGKRFIRHLLGAVAPSVAQLPVQVVR